jgi:Fe2+ transport system protein FeoA
MEIGTVSPCTAFLREIGCVGGERIKVAHVGLIGDIFHHSNELSGFLNSRNFFAN